jgi:hypothetical protein
MSTYTFEVSFLLTVDAPDEQTAREVATDRDRLLDALDADDITAGDIRLVDEW